VKPGTRAATDWDGPAIIGQGQAHAVADAPGEKPVGKLYLPDPEQRRGWREYYVPQSGAGDAERPVGFRPR
jgi:hypothetical protein